MVFVWLERVAKSDVEVGVVMGSRFRSRSDVGEPGHAFGAIGWRLLRKADVFTDL